MELRSRLPRIRFFVAAALITARPLLAQEPAQRERVQPTVEVTVNDRRWLISGARTTVTAGRADLAVTVRADKAEWSMAASGTRDMIVRTGGKEFPLRLADAGKIDVVPYRTGFRTGVKITLSGWRRPGASAGSAPLGLTLFLTMGLESRDEELVFDVVADEDDTVVRQLDWPPALDAKEVDYTVLPNIRGNLIPRGWPQAFNPIRPPRREEGTNTDTSEIQSNVIESWSMSWWGFKKGPAAMMVIVETPNDAAYQFEHPAGGPTVVGPRWRASLGRLAYQRTARMCFFGQGDYVTLAKRYRRYAMETGLFVSLKEKIARSPRVKSLIATPLSRVGILRNLREDSQRYDRQDPSKNYSLTTFDQRATQLRELKAKGIEKLHVCLTGWPYLGYDRQHPDELPPPPQAGGVEGMKRLVDTARELGYVTTFHDQYRDYYVDAPSYDAQFAIHEEDDIKPPQAFPGTRFGIRKEGRVPFMSYWDGGKQTFLNSRFMLGHLRQNYEWLAERGVRPDGVYLDVFGYVPPDEDWSREHPTTRTDNLRDRAACYDWTRHNVGIVGTEAACDWTVRYADISSPLGPARCVPVPLFELVYHDAIITTYSPVPRTPRPGDVQPSDAKRDRLDLYGFLSAGLPQIGLNDLDKHLETVRRMAALQERLATVEMTKHEFLDAKYRKERTTFADGTTVTVDWDAETVTVAP